MKYFLIFVTTLFLASAGYFTYEKWIKHSDLETWNFVPSDAAMVIEAEFIKDLQSFESFPASTILKESSGFETHRKALSFLDSINGDGVFTSTFENAPTLASMHKVSSKKVDFLFIIKLQNTPQNAFVTVTINRLKKNGHPFKTRNYNDFEIHEISNNDKTLTFLLYKDFFIASFSPYLVEDAIRTVNDTEILSFKETFTQLDEPSLSGLSSVYVNYQEFSQLLDVFLSTHSDFPVLSGKYDLTLDSSVLQLSGFSYTNGEWMSTHTEPPTTFEMAKVIPINTAYLYHITSSDFSSWKDKQIEYLRTNNAQVKQYQDSLKALYNFETDQVFDLIDNEIGIANLELTSSGEHQKLLILKVKDIEESLRFFSQVTKNIALTRGDSVYSEAYSKNEIRFLPISEFPSLILGEMADGFKQCFYINYRNHLVFSNDLQKLKKFILSMDNEDTWGKSIRINNFIEHVNKTANVSLFVNIPRTRNALQNNLTAEWNEHFKKNASVYKSLDMAAFQYSYLDGRYFTNYTFTQPIKREIEEITKAANSEHGKGFNRNLITKPHLLRTHAHKSFDLLIQDDSNTIYYMDLKQNILWTKDVGEPIQSDIHLIDYYKNGKIQYVFATSTHVHIIDRTGKEIPSYPKTLPNSPTIDHLNLIDYDQNKQYRIAVTDVNGNIYLTDKHLKVLDGWNPKTLNRRSTLPLEHTRLDRIDVLLSFQENGVINLMNRQGEFMKNFPFDTQQSLSKNYHLRKSNSLANSSITVLSNGGELTQLNFKGEKINHNQLIKTSADAIFQLIPDNRSVSFIIVRKEANTYEVLDNTGNLLFKKSHVSSGDMLIQYYQFGAGKNLILFTDTENRRLYIYDKSGNLITEKPLNSAYKVSLVYSRRKRECAVYTSWNSHLEVYKLNY